MKAKPIFDVFYATQFGTGAQPVKANNKTEAKKKFNKRYKNKTIFSVVKHEGKLIIPAI